jgi:hypothetical protein
MRCLLLLVTSFALIAAGEMPLTVAKLTDFIKSAVQLKQPDKQVAEMLRHFKMVEKLDDRTIEDLQGLGAGPRTVTALKELGDASVSLPEAAPPPPKPVVVPIPPPDSVEQAKIIDEAREYVMNYTQTLPNFICVQVTRRDVDRAGTGSSWYHMDTITARLSYNGQHEDYEVILKDNQPVTNVKMEQLGGTVSAGEFGTMMSEIFEPQSHAQFSWDHWATLRGRLRYRAGIFALSHQGDRDESRDRSGLSRPDLRGPRYQEHHQNHTEPIRYSRQLPHPRSARITRLRFPEHWGHAVHAAAQGCTHVQACAFRHQERYRVPALSQV